jgi:hypothetical protein
LALDEIEAGHPQEEELWTVRPKDGRSNSIHELEGGTGHTEHEMTTTTTTTMMMMIQITSNTNVALNPLPEGAPARARDGWAETHTEAKMIAKKHS